MTASTLYLVATPIGNLGDITRRAIDTLKAVDVIAAEDTRNSIKLLNHLDISKPLVSFEKHQTKKRIPELLALLGQGKSIALITDAGTPGIADPGHELVAAIRQTDIHVNIIPIPGASSVTAALSVSGFDAGEFVFAGFLPVQTKARAEKLRQILDDGRITVFFEAPHRIQETLEALKLALAEMKQESRKMFFARELTKKFETTYFGTILEINNRIGESPTKGEWLGVIGPNKSAVAIKSAATDWQVLRRSLESCGVSKKDQLKIISECCRIPRNQLYKQLLID